MFSREWTSNGEFVKVFCRANFPLYSNCQHYLDHRFADTVIIQRKSLVSASKSIISYATCHEGTVTDKAVCYRI